MQFMEAFQNDIWTTFEYFCLKKDAFGIQMENLEISSYRPEDELVFQQAKISR